MYKFVVAIFITAMFVTEAVALYNAEPAEPRPYNRFYVTENIDEPQPNAPADIDNLEIKEPTIIEPVEPYFGEYETKDAEVIEPPEPVLTPRPDKEPAVKGE